MLHLETTDPTLEQIYTDRAFSREDEEADPVFYRRERMVSHLDSRALGTVSEIIGKLVVEKKPWVLDLMASWDSHIPETLQPAHVVGLGLNHQEIERNEALDDGVIHDVNADPVLPFADDTFDVVLNTVSVDYMTRPFELFREVSRVLRPGGLFLVIFSNRMFLPKAVRVWREASDPERMWIVEDYFRGSGAFGATSSAVSQGLPRPPDDPHAGQGIPSDPVHAVWAQKPGGDPARPARPELSFDNAPPWDEEEIRARKERVRETMRCPYCGEKLSKWEVPQTPFTEWDAEYLYICFKDQCPYLLRGWHAMGAQGIAGMSYRLMYNPTNDRCMPVPIYSLTAMRENIVKG